MKKILFICLGNICRSPMAEYIFRQRATEQGLNVQVSSAGTSGWHDGEYMHCGTAEILDGLRIPSKNFVSKRVRSQDWQEYDYFIVMDNQNLTEMENRFGTHPKKLFKITDMLPENSPYNHIPDPWYTGNFMETRDLLEQCCAILIQHLKDGHL